VSSRWLVICSVVCACGGKTAPVVTPPSRASVAQSQPRLPARPKNTLYRDEIEHAKRAGLGHFFERVELEPRGETDQNGRMISFEGFQIVALRPAHDWLSFDFAPGDVLTHINGVSVEHYSTWYTQFESLPKAEQIRVDLVRDGKPTTIVVHIVERNGADGRVQPSARSSLPTSARPTIPAPNGAKN
jgi:S1-C subfamily serine protease